MIPPPPSKILVGISLDPDHSIELLSWATRVLAQSNDTIVAIHVRVGEESKKGELIKKKQWQIRQAKAHVISVLGEFARTCQSKQINLEARVGFSSGIARALTEEAKSFSADYLLLRGSRNRSNSGSTSSTIENHINSETERHNSSPRTVLHQLEAESHSTEDDTCSLGDLSVEWLEITDFGLAKWLPNKVTHHAVIPIEGTFGYLAPEYFMHGIVDEKTDVFAFGVLLLEIITGRRPVDSTQQNLLLWAKPLMESGNITELADRPELEGKFDSDQVQRVVLTASYCVRQSSTWRPSMSEVLELLTSGHDSEVARSWRMPRFTPWFLDTSAVARINAVKSGNSFYLFVVPFSVPFFH
ncbi:hypothetical protein OIU74_028876 [Salix koriyanagi]|uniref:Protein kinase domain-containing protein n=1 Tax=Salix koriyanagi TaxID=2511006 RepID=A0A9Q0VDJ4_9ROSI|nr:hypothetical protein OIU74_028876 [Salix koriyanagi]